MAFEPLRFIHASDFQLGSVMRGLGEVPAHLRDLLVDCTYLAATRVFDAAIHNHVDFLVLAGNIYNFQESGPRGYTFLQEQFERLAKEKIAVYWAGGRMEAPEHAQSPSDWPGNVTIFPNDRVHAVTHTREGHAIAKVAGISFAFKRRLRPQEFSIRENNLPLVGVAHSKVDASMLREDGPDYWAFGSETIFRTVTPARPMVVYSGSPQSVEMSDSGAHGCARIQIDLGGTPRLIQLPTDVVRCYEQQISIESVTNTAGLEALLRQRTEALITAEATVLVRWIITGGSMQLHELQNRCDVPAMLNRLREEFGKKLPAVWATDIEFDDRLNFPFAWYEEDTILGDYLRTLRQHQHDSTFPSMNRLIVEGADGGAELSESIAVRDQQRAQQLLRRATILGTRLLRGEEPKS